MQKQCIILNTNTNIYNLEYIYIKDKKKRGGKAKARHYAHGKQHGPLGIVIH